jgi:hypothetical protein
LGALLSLQPTSRADSVNEYANLFMIIEFDIDNSMNDSD